MEEKEFNEISNVMEEYENISNIEKYIKLLNLLGVFHIDFVVNNLDNPDTKTISFLTTHGFYDFTGPNFDSAEVLFSLTGVMDENISKVFNSIIRPCYNSLIYRQREMIWRSNFFCKCGNAMSWPERNILNKCEKCGSQIERDINVTEEQIKRQKKLRKTSTISKMETVTE